MADATPSTFSNVIAIGCVFFFYETTEAYHIYMNTTGCCVQILLFVQSARIIGRKLLAEGTGLTSKGRDKFQSAVFKNIDPKQTSYIPENALLFIHRSNTHTHT